jgi:hypothetical protein
MRARAVAATQCRQLIFIRSAQSRAQTKPLLEQSTNGQQKAEPREQSLFTWRYEKYIKQRRRSMLASTPPVVKLKKEPRSPMFARLFK